LATIITFARKVLRCQIRINMNRFKFQKILVAGVCLTLKRNHLSLMISKTTLTSHCFLTIISELAKITECHKHKSTTVKRCLQVASARLILLPDEKISNMRNLWSKQQLNSYSMKNTTLKESRFLTLKWWKNLKIEMQLLSPDRRRNLKLNRFSLN